MCRADEVLVQHPHFLQHQVLLEVVEVQEVLSMEARRVLVRSRQLVPDGLQAVPYATRKAWAVPYEGQRRAPHCLVDSTARSGPTQMPGRHFRVGMSGA